MNYLDEHIVSLKAKLMDQTTANNGGLQSIPAQNQESEQNGSMSEQNKLFHIQNEHLALEPRTILDGEIGFYIPKSFSPMPVEQAAVKYPSEHRPQDIYTSAEGTINISFNPTDSFLEVDELSEFVEQMADVLRSVQPIRNWLGSEMFINHSGLSIGRIRFIAAGIDGNLYNELLLFIHKGRVVIGSFSCLEAELEAWLPVAEYWGQSLRALTPFPYSANEKGMIPR
ncbi:hypothetical protein P4H71_00465 [Paenibacillus kribbensis]|uniref:hypothetical protein n=1 Tax=Paenibacillus kribbensis TaxID=172713 RepID=UPI002DBD1684|nr:hypothetical protein [Paenibacillus kribbensis]MEC0232826.1 hypothetical protein [Paenibacillus kribbensis]